MCLAIPACIETIDDNHMAQVDILGVKREAALDLTPQAQVGDYVLVHAGFAIEVVDTKVAEETLEIVRLLDPAALEEMQEGALPAAFGADALGGGLGGPPLAVLGGLLADDEADALPAALQDAD